MPKKNILLQIDPDSQASSFDSIVAIDSGVEELLVYQGVSSMEIQTIVHGAMFTRGVDDLKSTALFFGGTNVSQSESLVRATQKCFFGPMRVSLMSDPNGSNTTAAAAVISAEHHLSLDGATVTILAATGPVGQRIAKLVLSQGGTARVCSRSLDRANDIFEPLRDDGNTDRLKAIQTNNPNQTLDAIAGADVVFSAGAAAIQLLGDEWQSLKDKPKVLIDLNAVPPAGIEGIEVTDKAKDRSGSICYGAIGVGGLKMKIHRQCIARLFEANDLVLDTEEIFALGQKKT